MDQTVAIAVGSAVVSLAAVAANLYIARRSHQSNLELEAAKSALKRLDSGADAIRELEVEGELLRIRCWKLIGLAEAFCHSSADQAEHRGDFADLSRASRKFAQQADSFLDTWASARTEVPEEILALARTARHECRFSVESVLMLCAPMDRTGRLGHVDAHKLSTTLRRLLSLIDHFILTVSAVRGTLSLTKGAIRRKPPVDALSRKAGGGER